MFEYEWVNEEVAADIGNNIIRQSFKILIDTPNSNILTLTIPSAKMPELTDPVECPSCPYTLQPDYQGKNITFRKEILSIEYFSIVVELLERLKPTLPNVYLLAPMPDFYR